MYFRSMPVEVVGPLAGDDPVVARSSFDTGKDALENFRASFIAGFVQACASETSPTVTMLLTPVPARQA